MAEEIIDAPIEKEMQGSYIDYAMSVIVGRALPDARDGLKPAQRRTLYAMQQLGNTHDKPTIKSARVVGTVIGRFHPHGDIAAYETLVRMAQDFSMNHTLVQGQGNMGSIDGDSPAAQRYTEVRLNKLAEELLQDLEKKAVKFVPNFDSTEEEPLVLPAKVPNLLVNGASGIAVGVATNILQHNLREVCDAVVAYVDNPNLTPQELLQYIKGPDLATGGIVFYNNGLLSSYLTGRGSCIIRGKTVKEEGKNRNSIIIKEIPYTVNKATLVHKIAELVKEKKLQGVADLRDESGKEGIRVVIELKKDANPDQVLNMLYAHTPLQISLPAINIAVVGNNLVTFNIRQFIKVFVDHRIEVIKARTKFDLDVASDRLHIVDGLLVAIANINEVVATIKKSSDTKDARANLMNNYSLSEKQANAILDMKLSKLTSLESSSLKSEKDELKVQIDSFKEILANEQKVFQIIKDETKEVKDKYGRDRRTEIVQSDITVIENEDLIKDEDVTVILTNNNYMKRLPTNLYKAQGRGGKGVIAIQLRENDYVRQIISCMSKDYLLALTSKGRAYWLKAYQVPEEGKYSHGKAAVNLINLSEGEKVEMLINTRSFEKKFLTFITTKGKIKRLRAEKFSRPRSSGIIAMPLLEGDSISDVCISDGESNLFIATKLGKGLRFNENDLRPMSRIAHGVRGIRVAQNDEVVNVLAAKETDMIATITEKGSGKITELSRYRLQHRGGKGVINLKVKEKTGGVVRSIRVNQQDYILIINSMGLSIQFPIAEIRITGRGASGVRLMRVEKNTVVVDAQIISKEEAASVQKGTATPDPTIEDAPGLEDPDNENGNGEGNENAETPAA
ncbi:MAG: DNA gyrase subunit A [Candidatus Marsarchaeota archaeon]|nr:DNA gyrase subunit A [Candidatus Marsarchaeota archaeon]